MTKTWQPKVSEEGGGYFLRADKHQMVRLNVAPYSTPYVIVFALQQDKRYVF